MRREEFIKTSLLTLGGLGLVPVALKSLDFIDSGYALRVNEHIRHGAFGADCFVNEINHKELVSVRIDQFMNPDGDMHLYQIETLNSKMNIGLMDSRVYIQTQGELVEKAIKKEGVVFESDVFRLENSRDMVPNTFGLNLNKHVFFGLSNQMQKGLILTFGSQS